ncbi:MAG: glycosyltransferase family 2 protein [Desulfobacula sp.]|jgi:glycosyltransferase involved in cell wall biosynthesis|uniref:glycosyltransferase family 2 protein n=1 Tax=Desulfobacula sp. TaxID=2593537 RepID=UPI001E16862D|nr:glycosyltransferase family 2 protein [Desulfobacula sp.]MBT3484485.1 glycosyltransferase family 2 protein [Desulfobacula sp.]MBT3803123.1 glycosyltransferase family 2 protein [Desulfobacula sp.]MBT4024693.1 glycosyltransferase family 2 protein [Desulfobacula sp.]MBT4197171.1 glycosyltransferase family 2 protein [Desulfobacula sp.]
MKISLIITTYNRPGALKRVLDGLISQTILPEEIIIADDGSDNNTKTMLQPFLDQTQINIKHVWHEDIGFRAARIRNMAIAESNGDYIILLDGDCIPEKHFIQDHKDLAQKGFFFQGKRVIVNQSFAKIFNHKDCNSKTILMIQSLKKEISNSHHIFRIPFFPSYTIKKLSGVRSCNMGLFRDDITAVNGFNHDFEGWGREDSELVVRLFKYGLKRKENPFKAICFHLWHHDNKRNCLEKNDRILKKVMESESFFCKSGLNELV